jgi:hypothetical protein
MNIVNSLEIKKYCIIKSKPKPTKLYDFLENQVKRLKKKLETSCSIECWILFIIFFWNYNYHVSKNFRARKGIFIYDLNTFGTLKGNPIGNVDYFPSLFLNLKNHEKNYMTATSYMKYQRDINIKMRTILVDWLIDVHVKFKLAPKTLFLTFNILDRFLSIKRLSRQKLQLLGITAMLIASKYEEIYAPETKDFVYISDNAYTKEDIFKMETLVCSVLKFEFSYPSIFFFLTYFLRNMKAGKISIYLSNYLAELTLLEIYMLKFRPSKIAFCVAFLVKKLLKFSCQDLGIVDFIPTKKNFSEEKNNLKECLSILKSLLVLDQNEKQKNLSIKKKYSLRKFGEISSSQFSLVFCF